MKSQTELSTLTLPTRIALYSLILGMILLLGGIPYQILIGLTRVGTGGDVEKIVYQLMSGGSLMLIVGYVLVFAGGIAFWLLGPYKLRRDRWFLVTFLAFYLWLPLDWYFISCDLRFALGFNPTVPLSHELKQLFDAREAFTPLPLLQLVGYLIALGMAVFRPNLSRQEA